MRLTLRALLAYLDEILEPEDTEDIGKRIQESEVASALLHRVRDVMRRLRLQAPQVDQTGKGLDPNTVAEYLDHVLPDDRVPDFERICLESDMHLAEVASCHQILALVLGEPAEVNPASREHMYALPQVAAELEAMEARQGGESSSGDGRTGVGPPPPPRRPRPVVPDYLREPAGRRRRFPWAVAVVLLIGVGVIGLVLADHFGLLGGDRGEPVARETSKPVASVDDAQPSAPEGGQAPVDQRTTDVGPAEGTTEPPVPEPVETEPAPGQPTGLVEGAPSPVIEPTEVGPERPSNVDEPVLPPGPTRPSGPADPATVTLPKAPVADRLVVNPPDEPAREEAKPPQHVGLFVSDASEHQLLLQFDPQSHQWNRLPVQGILVPGRPLLSFPAFRPLIALTSGLRVQFRGGTQINLQTVDGQEVPLIELKFGHLVVGTVGKPETRLRLSAGGRTGTLTFVDPVSRAAIETIWTLIPGSDPEKDPVEAVVNIYALSGRLVWEADDGLAKIEFKTPSRLALGPTGAGPAVPIDKFPGWAVSSSVDTLDRGASRRLEEAIQVDRPVTLGLKERLDHRRSEVRQLASRCLGYVGDFGPLADVLNDPEQKLDWPDYIEELRQAMARGPDVAAQVRAGLEGAYGTDGAKLYRMLWGYNAQQLIDGQDAELVDALDHELLAMRVVSFWNLNAITGAQLYYRPENPLSKRQKAVRTWRKRLENGEIRLKPTAAGGLPARPGVPADTSPKKDAAPPAGSPAAPTP